MTNDEFRETLDRIGLTQALTAQLLGVTARSVNLWATGGRSVPGPVQGYLRLFESIPQAFRDVEIAYARKDETMIKEGMYGLSFSSASDYGLGTLVLDEGRVYGVDVAGVRYDGEYTYNSATKMVESEIKITVPPDTVLVTGIPAQPYEWAFTVKAAFPSGAKDYIMAVDVPGGKVNARIEYLREMPS